VTSIELGVRGSVTAEFAAVVPAVLLVLAACLGGIQVVGQQVRMTDAAADGARSLARGDGADVAAGHIRESVGPVALATERRGEFVCVRLSAPASFGLAAAFGLTVAARGCALAGGL
jgi:hypothetical protein